MGRFLGAGAAIRLIMASVAVALAVLAPVAMAGSLGELDTTPVALELRNCPMDADHWFAQPRWALEFTAKDTQATYVFDTCGSPHGTWLRVFSIDETEACETPNKAAVFSCIDCGASCGAAGRAEASLPAGDYSIIVTNIHGAKAAELEQAAMAVTVASAPTRENDAGRGPPGRERRLQARECDFYEANTQLLPFGDCADNDVVFPTEPNGPDQSVSVPLNFSLRFFGSDFDQLWMSNNAIFSFRAEFSDYTPDPFPYVTGVPLIAVYWADTDIRRFGRIWYRELLDAATLDRADDLLRSSSFALPTGYFSTGGFLATWDDVTYYGGNDTTPRNTFQGLLLTDGRRAFAVFIYEELNWSAGILSGGDPATGLIEGSESFEEIGPARAGFDAGDGERFFVIPTTSTDDVVNLDERSNVGVEGIFAFRIDGDEVFQNCTEDSSVGMTPELGTANGGETLTFTVGDLCFTRDLSALCVFRTPEGVDLGSTAAVVADATSLDCVLPTLGITGVIEVSVAVTEENGGQGEIALEGTYIAINVVSGNAARNVSSSGVQVTEADPIVAGDVDITLEWDPTAIPGGAAVVLAVYTSCFSDDIEFTLLVDEDVPNSGSYSFSNRGIFDAAPADSFDVFLACTFEVQPVASGTDRVRRRLDPVFTVASPPAVANTLTFPPVIVFPEAPELSQTLSLVESIALIHFFDGPDECNPDKPLEFFRGLPRCPCFENLVDRGLWDDDPACHRDNVLAKLLGKNCKFHPGADSCYRRQTPGAATQAQCCYASDGALITDPARGAGSADCRSGLLSHYVYDVAPYNILPPAIYNRYRPPTIEACAPAPLPVTWAWGDPHLATLDGLRYTFNGCGEFVFARASSGCNLEIHARMEPRAGGTVFTGFAIRVAGMSDVVQLLLRGERVQVLFAGGEVTFLSSEYTVPLGSLSVGLTRSGGGGVAVGIAGCFSVTVRAAAGALDIGLSLDRSLADTLEGLVGNFDGDSANDLRAATGTHVSATAPMETVHFDFGLTWQVTDSSERLFDGAASFDEATVCAGYTPTFLDITEATLDTVAPETRTLCNDDLACIFDFTITGDAAVASNTANVSVAVQVAQDAAAAPPPITCEAPPAPVNGTLIVSSFFVGGTLQLQCLPGLEVGGLGFAICGDTGGFEPSELGSCVEAVSAAPSLGPTAAERQPTTSPSTVPIASPVTMLPSIAPTILASAAPTASPASDTGSNSTDDCFSALSTVQIEGQAEPRAMKDVRVGDRILVAQETNGELGYAAVVFLPHATNDVAASFLDIRHRGSDTSLSVTPAHLLAAADCASGAAAGLARADAFEAGKTCLLTEAGAAEITAIEPVTRRGVYTAVTEESGALLVIDGVLASPFAYSHGLVDAYYNLHRLAHRLAPSMLIAAADAVRLTQSAWIAPLAVMAAKAVLPMKSGSA